MTAFEFLCRIRHIPCIDFWSHPKGAGSVRTSVCSKGERRRLLINKAVIINGARPGPTEEIQFPIDELIFFPNSKNRCTMIYESSVDKTESILGDK